MGKLNHIIQVEPISADGIVIHNEQLNGKNNILSQVHCVLCMKRNVTIKSKASMPIRQSMKNSVLSTSSCSARWWYDEDEEKMLSINAKLDGKKAKVFDFSIRLRRGDEEIEIGTSSLTFVGVVLSAELDIPIYKLEGIKPTVTPSKSKDKNGIFRLNKKVWDSAIMEDIKSQLKATGKAPPKTFRGGDGGRSYSVKSDASIRVKVGSALLDSFMDLAYETQTSPNSAICYCFL